MLYSSHIYPGYRLALKNTVLRRCFRAIAKLSRPAPTPEPGAIVLEDNIVLLSFDVPESTTCEYILERSQDGISFVKIAGAGSGPARKICHVDHPDPKVLVYYRVRVTDRPGVVQSSRVKTVSLREGVFAAAVLPGSCRDGISFDLHLFYAKPSENMIVAVYNSLGKEVTSILQSVRHAGEQVLTLRSAVKLAPGIYEVVSAFNNAIFRDRLIVR